MEKTMEIYQNNCFEKTYSFKTLIYCGKNYGTIEKKTIVLYTENYGTLIYYGKNYGTIVNYS